MHIDTHCHLNFKDYKDDYNEVIKRSLSNGVEMIIVGSNLESSQRAVSLSKIFDGGVYSAMGVHPIYVKDDYSESDYLELAKDVVAIGEIGLDYYHAKETKDLQKEIFVRQLNLAKKLDLPVIIHCREAHDDLFKILKDFYSSNNLNKEWGVIHCYSGNYKQAKQYFDIGLKISFTGLITFVRQWDEVIKKSPLEKLMIETDSPYLTPDPFRGKRNEPLYVKEVAKTISSLRGKDCKDQLYKNSIDFFNLS